MGGTVLVVGAGSSGLVAARVLADKPGCLVTVVDALGDIGGAHASVAARGFMFDPGLFLFGPTAPFFTAFGIDPTEFVKVAHSPLKLLDGGATVAYPFDAHEQRRLLRDWRSVASLAWGRLARWRRANAKQWAEYYLGAHVLKETGLLNYITRFNQRDAAEIHPIFCERRMSTIPRMTSPRWIFRRLTSPGAGQSAVPCLVRPPAGFAAVYDRVRRSLVDSGIEFVLNESSLRVRRQGDAFVASLSGRERTFDRVVWSVPLGVAHEIVDGVSPAPAMSLQLVSLFFSAAQRPEIAGDCLYNFTSEGRWKRLTILSDYYGFVDGRAWFTVEVTVPAGLHVDPWAHAAEFVALGEQWGFLRGEARLEGSNVNEHAYPCYMPAHVETMALVQAQLERQGIECIGKQGRFDYIPSSTLGADLIGRYFRTGQWRGE